MISKTPQANEGGFCTANQVPIMDTIFGFFCVNNVRKNRICTGVKGLFKRLSESRDIDFFLSWLYNTHRPLTCKPLLAYPVELNRWSFTSNYVMQKLLRFLNLHEGVGQKYRKGTQLGKRGTGAKNMNITQNLSLQIFWMAPLRILNFCKARAECHNPNSSKLFAQNIQPTLKT